MRNVREKELLEWASMRADDAGRLARELVEFRNEMIEVLEACETYFDNRADADGDEPNREMILLSMVQAALSRAS
jgi:hypothetical protein